MRRDEGEQANVRFHPSNHVTTFIVEGQQRKDHQLALNACYR